MKLERIDALLADSARLDWPWEWLVLHGGEPTTHPDFSKICQKLRDYKTSYNPDVEIIVCTNGHGERIRNQLEIAKGHGFTIANSQKNTGIPQYHIDFLVSAVDVGKDYTLGCFQSSMCGICYTNSGFYECSPAGAAHRLFGYEPMAVNLGEITVEKLADGYARHCLHCGYARIDDVKMLSAMSGRKEPHQTANPTASISKTWATAIGRYNSQHS